MRKGSEFKEKVKPAAERNFFCRRLQRGYRNEKTDILLGRIMTSLKQIILFAITHEDFSCVHAFSGCRNKL